MQLFLRLLHGRIAVALLLFSATMTVVAAEADIFIIANPQSEVRQLDRAQMRAIFSLGRQYWPNGTPVRVATLQSDSPQHAEFCQQILGVYPHVLDVAWTRQMASGQAWNGRTFTTEKQLLEYVRRVPGAIGYVSSMSHVTDDLLTVEVPR